MDGSLKVWEKESDRKLHKEAQDSISTLRKLLMQLGRPGTDARNISNPKRATEAPHLQREWV